MSHAIEISNSTRCVVDDDLAEAIVRAVLHAEGVIDGELGVSFVGERRIRELNREFRGRDEVTDVLSFPLESDDEIESWSVEEGVGSRHGGADEDDGGDGAAVSPPVPADAPPRLLGDIVICLRRAQQQARQDGLSPDLEVAVLLVHGVLHILGHDHETDAGAMALRQAELLTGLSWEGLLGAPE